jgi:hypothetical protein
LFDYHFALHLVHLGPQLMKEEILFFQLWEMRWVKWVQFMRNDAINHFIDDFKAFLFDL